MDIDNRDEYQMPKRGAFSAMAIASMLLAAQPPYPMATFRDGPFVPSRHSRRYRWIGNKFYKRRERKSR